MSSFKDWTDGISGTIRAMFAMSLLGSPTVLGGEGGVGGAGASYSLGGNGWMSASGGAGSSSGWSSGNGSAIGGFGGAGAAGSGSGHIDYFPPIIYGIGPNGPFAYSYPLVVVGPGGYPPVPQAIYPPPALPVPVPNHGGAGAMRLPMPPRQPTVTRASTTRRPNPTRSKEYVEIGDRSFRGDNNKKAEERYRLAIKADPTSAVPHVRLAQVALVRGRYADAAKHFRDAVAAEPGFLLNAPDIESVYSEPADFARELAELEKHLQAEPGDRDAWFVLGAEWYLSGRTQKAADAFQRLTDRRPDLALAAFLDATSPRRAATVKE